MPAGPVRSAGIQVAGALVLLLLAHASSRSSWSTSGVDLLAQSGTKGGPGGGARSAETVQIEREEEEGLRFKKMAGQFRKAARVAAEEERDAHRKGPVDTLEEASQTLDAARGRLSSASDHAALQRLAASLREYSHALKTHADGLEFEAPGAYKELSDFQLEHPIRQTRRQERIPDDEVSSSLLSASANAREAQRLARRAVGARPRSRPYVRSKGHRTLPGDVSALSRETAWARQELKSLAERPGPRHAFPAFASAVKGFPYNVMGNMMTAVNAL